MRLGLYAWRAPAGASRRSLAWAVVIAAFALPLVAACLIWLIPQACAAQTDPATHRWICLLPGLLLTVPFVLAPLLGIATALNIRLGRPVPDGWGPTVFLAGALVEIVLIGAYLMLLGPGYGVTFLVQGYTIWQPWIAGALTAAVLWHALHNRRGEGR